jgi:hypothetical protein
MTQAFFNLLFQPSIWNLSTLLTHKLSSLILVFVIVFKFLSFIYLSIYLFIFVVLGIKSRVSHMLGKHSITELHSQASLFGVLLGFFIVVCLVFWCDWGLNSGLHACKADSLQLELQSILLWLF